MKAVSYTNKRLQAQPTRIHSAPRMHVDIGPRSTEKVRSVLLAVLIGVVLAFVAMS